MSYMTEQDKRYDRIRAAMEYRTYEQVRDVLTDLMHYADIEGEDFWEELRIAQDNYKAELEGNNSI